MVGEAGNFRRLTALSDMEGHRNKTVATMLNKLFARHLSNGKLRLLELCDGSEPQYSAPPSCRCHPCHKDKGLVRNRERDQPREESFVRDGRFR